MVWIEEFVSFDVVFIVCTFCMVNSVVVGIGCAINLL